jgi:transmembrane sensor
MTGKEDSGHEMSPRKDRLRELFARRTSVRDLIAQEAADWFIANREGLDSIQRATFAAWLRTSPMHIEEYLNIALIGRDLREASNDPAVSLEDLVARALEPADPVGVARPPAPLQSRPGRSDSTQRPRWRPQLWLSGAAAVAAIGVVTLAFLFWRNRGTPPDGAAIAYNIQTRHGEQLTRQLPDASFLKLDTDTSVSVRFDRTQRLVTVFQGRADFIVAHDPRRKFVVQAGTVGITDVGTEFAVYARPQSTLVTVLEGRVAVAVDPRISAIAAHESSAPPAPYAPVEVAAGQQVRVENGSWPPTYTPVDRQRATAWMRRQIVFQNEALEQVVAEFNRYAATPIEIESPALRTLALSGVFAADDEESFVTFLRSLDGVRVEVAPTRIRVSRK